MKKIKEMKIIFIHFFNLINPFITVIEMIIIVIKIILLKVDILATILKKIQMLI
jgi:hypothetical protein